MFVQKCGSLLKYRIQANLDEKAVVFFTQKKFLLRLRLSKKKLVFLIIIFLWEKIKKF